MSDKLREQFEAWYIERANKATGLSMPIEDVARKRGESGDYDDFAFLHGCWIGWQASRAALVVELPIDVTGGHYRLAVESCKRCIEAAGVKVAP